MTKRAQFQIRHALATRQSSRALPGLVALGLVLLQLITALHFALIPHGFNAGLSGFEHVHGRLVSGVSENAPDRPAFVTGARTSAPDACPIGFSGPVSVLLAPAAAIQRLALPVSQASLAGATVATRRAQLLLTAPKTSPPCSA